MPVHEAPNGHRARVTPERIATEICFVVGIALVLAMLRPLGVLTDESFGTRLFYWGRSLVAGYVIQRPLLWLGSTWLTRAGRPEWLGWALAIVVGSVPMSLWLWYLGPSINLSRPFPSEALWAETAGQYILVAGLVAVCLWFVQDIAQARGNSAPTAPSLAEPSERHVPQRPALLDRLERTNHQTLWALEAEDHYVRVHTDAGHELVLMRLADAIAETAPVEGQQVHRSWWVAKQAIKAAEMEGRTLMLKLERNIQIPVARNRISAVRDWLKP
ncbi:LytTR family DNA-binding domain-containing protein [uncultured Brevundimonas sp.]|uniref:LytTR family DNA-binding domain-containing protein n=1 Tax=uncultured Brevundimonas sp. TaxID=213418 RepID=UPI00260BAA17|nr:LytTR family DNA-binding domain-containing protein [uncultured Brevundimonas sp.]